MFDSFIFVYFADIDSYRLLNFVKDFLSSVSFESSYLIKVARIFSI